MDGNIANHQKYPVADFLGWSPIFREKLDIWLPLNLNGPLRNNFSNLDIFAVDDIWNVILKIQNASNGKDFFRKN